MSAATMVRPARHVFEFCANDRVEVEHNDLARLSSHLKADGPAAWLWCQHCERGFQVGAVLTDGDKVSCGYADCAGEPLDFWSWRAYRAFVGTAPETPELKRRYPLAA